MKNDVIFDIIKKVVYAYYNISEREMDKNIYNRSMHYNRIRQIVMTYCSRYSTASLKEIGILYRKDHATVLHAENSIKNLEYTDKYFKVESEVLQQKICKMIEFEKKKYLLGISPGMFTHHLKFNDIKPSRIKRRNLIFA